MATFFGIPLPGLAGFRDPTQQQVAQLQGMAPADPYAEQGWQPFSPGAARWSAAGSALTNLGAGLLSGRNWSEGLSRGLMGANQGFQDGMQNARRDYYVDQQGRYMQSKMAAEQRKEQRTQQQIDQLNRMPPPNGMSADQWSTMLRVNPDYALKIAYPEPQAPTSEVRNFEYGQTHPEFAAQQEKLRRAGAPSNSVNVGGTVVNMPKPLQAGPEQMAKDGAAAYGQARDTIPLFQIARDAAMRFPQSGAGGNWSLAWERGKNWLGLKNNAQAGEVLQGVQTRLGSLQRLPGSGATSDMEMQMYMQAVPSLLNTQKGNLALASIGEKLARRRMANYEGWAKHYMLTGNPFDYQADDSPVLTEDEKATLLGAANEAPAPAAAGGGAQPPSDQQLLDKYGVK